MKYYWVHFKRCGHGDAWPCRQPKGASCGRDGWTVAIRTTGTYPYQVIGSDDIYRRDVFDRIVPFEKGPPR